MVKKFPPKKTIITRKRKDIVSKKKYCYRYTDRPQPTLTRHWLNKIGVKTKDVKMYPIALMSNDRH